MDEYIWPKITKETTIDELKEIHRRIWDYVMTHNMTKPLTPYFCDCSACEYVKQKHQSVRTFGPEFCGHCPIEWPEGKTCFDDHGLFRRFAQERQALWKKGILGYGDFLKLSELITQIRDVEWKDENT